MEINFNKAQLEAINHKDGPCVVIAGAGSGKSTVLVERIKTLVSEGVNERDIMAISFTKASAEDLKRKLNNKNILNVNVGTFHSILGRMLYNQGYNVYTSVPLFEIKKTFNKIKWNSDVEDILSFISYQKCFMKGPDDIFAFKESAYTDIELQRYYKAYENLKKHKNAYDFDDWLIKALEFLSARPEFPRPKYLLVDEHQDSNLVQNLLISQLCPSRNIFVVGDYRQAIYGFRGAEVRYFMNFSKEYPEAKVINLDYNYRSKKEIVDNANTFIKNYYGLYEHYSDSIAFNKQSAQIEIEQFETAFDQGEIISDRIHNLISMHNVNPKDIAILFRNNAQSAEAEISLIKRKIPYYIENEGNFFLSKQILPIISLIRLANNRLDDEAFENFVKCRCAPFEYFSNASFDSIVMTALTSGCSYIEAARMTNLQFKQKDMVERFMHYLFIIENQVKNFIPLTTIIDNIINLLDLQSFIKEKYQNLEEQQNRLKSFETLKSFAINQTVDGFIKFVLSGKAVAKQSKDNAVQLMTIHKSKGLEFKYVFVIGLQDNKFPSDKSDLESEARLFYVAVTRPIDFLFLSQIGYKNKFVEQYIGN